MAGLRAAARGSLGFTCVRGGSRFAGGSEVLLAGWTIVGDKGLGGGSCNEPSKRWGWLGIGPGWLEADQWGRCFGTRVDEGVRE